MTPRRQSRAVVILGVMAAPALVAAEPVAPEALRATEVAAPAAVARAAGRFAAPETVGAVRGAAAPAAVAGAAGRFAAPETMPAVPGAAAPAAVAGAAGRFAAPETVGAVRGAAAPAAVAGAAGRFAAPETVPAVPGAAARAAVAGAAGRFAAPETVPAVPGAAAPAAVAGAAGQAQAPETVRERESGVAFPLALTPPGSATPHWLMGTGIRQRTIFRVKVYAFGLYVDADAARAALAEFAGSTAEALGRDEGLTRRLLDLDFGMALRLVMTRTVSGGDVADAFDEALRPRMPRAGAGAAGDDAVALATLRGHLDVDEVRRGAEIVFACGPAGRLAMTVDRAERPPIESRALCRALFDVYLGDDPIEPDGRRNLMAGFAGLLQTLVRR